MAFASDSTTAPARPLLPFIFRPSPPIDDPRSSEELLEEIRRTIKEQEVCPTAGQTELPNSGDLKSRQPEPLLPAADLAQARHFCRELHQALDFGFALLDALDLGPLSLDVIDDAIRVLDALDAPEEDREDDDPAEGTSLERHGRGFVRCGADDAEDGDGCEQSDNGVADEDGYHEQCGFAFAGALPWSVGGYVG